MNEFRRGRRTTPEEDYARSLRRLHRLAEYEEVAKARRERHRDPVKEMLSGVAARRKRPVSLAPVKLPEERE